MNIVHQVWDQRVAFMKRNFREPDRLIMTRDKYGELMATPDIMQNTVVPIDTLMGMKIIVSYTDIDGGFGIR